MKMSLRGPRGIARSVVQKVVPQNHRLENYQAEFQLSADKFLKFWEKAKERARPKTLTPVGIVVMPWVGTAVPWYSIALALGLSQRGHAVTLIWDDTPFPQPSPFIALQNRNIARVLAEVGQTFPVLRISDQRVTSLDPQDARALERLASLNLTWRIRAGEPTEQDLQVLPDSILALRASLERTHSLLGENPFDYLIVPGGIPHTSGVFRLAGERAGLRVSTYDTNFGVVQIATEGIAAQLSDIPLAFHALATADPSMRTDALKEARAHLARRVRGQDEARYQPSMPRGRLSQFDRSVLIPLNVEHDSAALGQHTIFNSTAEWVASTVAFVLEQSNRMVVVRQHPAERNKFEGGSFNIRQILRGRFGDESRLHFVTAQDEVNTYDLVQAASLVIPFVSTIGIEAAIHGKPVIATGASCYADLGFVWRPRNRAEYWDLMKRGMSDELPILPYQQDNGLLCYYLTAICSRVWTNFTPQPSDFWDWCERAPAELFADEAVSDILTALERNVPLALIRHQRRMASAEHNHSV